MFIPFPALSHPTSIVLFPLYCLCSHFLIFPLDFFVCSISQLIQSAESKILNQTFLPISILNLISKHFSTKIFYRHFYNLTLRSYVYARLHPINTCLHHTLHSISLSLFTLPCITLEIINLR